MGDFITQLQAQTAGNPLALCLLTYFVCFVSGFVPVVNSEAYLISVSSLSPLSVALPLTLSAALGQMTAKVMLYFGGRGVMRLPLGRYQEKVMAVRSRFEARKGSTGLFLFGSAVTGFPPFYAVSIVAGMLRLALGSFVVAGVLGRFVRFGIVTMLPQLVRLWS